MALGRTVRFYSVTEIANMPMGFEYEYRRDKFNRDLERVSLVIFDDLGAERVTSTAREKVFDAIYRRYETGKPMIVTTNMSEKALKSPKGMEEERMLDRILHGAIVLDMGSISERSVTANNKWQTECLIFKDSNKRRCKASEIRRSKNERQHISKLCGLITKHKYRNLKA